MIWEHRHYKVPRNYRISGLGLYRCNSNIFTHRKLRPKERKSLLQYEQGLKTVLVTPSPVTLANLAVMRMDYLSVFHSDVLG